MRNKFDEALEKLAHRLTVHQSQPFTTEMTGLDGWDLYDLNYDVGRILLGYLNVSKSIRDEVDFVGSDTVS